jgi:nucleoside-diphosphate-sugar epimerase
MSGPAGAESAGKLSRWVVLGSHGFVGSAITRRLSELDIPHTTAPAPRLQADVDVTASELVDIARNHTELAGLAEAFQGVDVLIMAGGRAEPDARWSAGLVGANALAPVLVAHAAETACVSRLVHLSSAAVQGRRRALTEDCSLSPFSAYSKSKALGEEALMLVASSSRAEIVIVRATSVQGRGRPTTRTLQRVARSPLSSVAGNGGQPSAVSSVGALADFIAFVGMAPSPIPRIVLQPWEGLSVADVLTAAGRRDPLRLPEWCCRLAIDLGHAATRLTGGAGGGLVRRVESMWFGQEVGASWAQGAGFRPAGELVGLLSEGVYE